MSHKYLFPDWAAPIKVKAFTTLRAIHNNAENVHQNAFANFNLSCHSGDTSINVKQNRQQLQQDWQWPYRPVWLKQIHGTAIIPAHLQQTDIIPEADASWTNKPFLPCVVMTADCLPVIFTTRCGSKIAVVHAGWRGLAAGILEKTVIALEQSPTNLLVWLGPAISQPFFEVGDEVKKIFIQKQKAAEKAFIAGNNNRWYADIFHLARLQLQRLGIRAIYGGNFCTFSRNDLFYSYRRDKKTGRMATIAWIEP